MAKKYKCPYCDERYEREKLISHVEDEHEDFIPEKQTPTQVVFNSINKKDHGTCIVCKKPTKWNEKAGRYDRLCTNPRCKQKLREEFKKNAMKKDGTYVYTADPKFQEKMLRGRKISSTYTFTDGGKVDYVGSYEKKFLEFIDKVMNIESKDIMDPGPTIQYEYEGEIHYWITDFYYVPGNLVLDIKDGGKNPNTRPMEEYREKQLAKEATIRKMKKYNYLRLTDNNFAQFMEVLADLKYMALDIKETQLINKINESVFFNKNDLYWKFEDFESNKTNVLLITGLSGSGKSTLGNKLSKKYNAEYIELDALWDLHDKFEYHKNKNTIFYKYLKYKKLLEKVKESEITDKFYDSIVVNFIDYCISNSRDNKIIIEGIQIYEVYKDKARKYPLIIKGTSVIKSFLQKSINREHWSYKEFLKYSKQDLSWLIKSDKDLNDLKKSIMKPLNESNIQELSAAMSTVPPVYSSDASVLKAVDDEGNEITALSSLDFNDSILIDDPVEGIKKINKKYYKDNFVTKAQFLYPKNESYYNLLKSFKGNDACIYEGIYRNLSSFDIVLTEDQIYFDDKFKLVNQLPLQEMQNKIKEVNDAILCIGESTLIRYDKLGLNIIANEPIQINNIYNELKVELESNTDGFYMIKPSKDKEDLDKQFQKYNAQNDDQKKKSDNRSLTLYGMNNYDHYHILLSKIKKGTRDDELDGLEYNPHDEEIVKEDYDLFNLPKDFNCNSIEELDEEIEKAREFNKHTLGRVVIFPTQDANELESLYMKYMALSLNNRTSSDNKAKEIFGKTNREIYKFLQDNVIKTKNDDTEVNVKADKDIKNDSFSNDLPLVTPEELSEIDEDYSCFTEEDATVIKQWREKYISLNEEGYRDLNIKRLNILRKGIYKNNTDMIVQCGWIPGIEFNSKNRVRASKLVKNKIDNLDAFNNYIEESNDKSYIDKNHKQKGQKRLSDFKFFKTKNNDDGESYNLFWKDDNDKVVGKVTVDSIPASDGYRWFGSLEVSNKYRGYGLGKQILDIAVNRYKAGALAVYKDNEVAYKMYKNYGFKESSNRKSKDYYYMYLERNKDKSIKESYIEEAKIIKPEKCTKCGSTNIGVFIQGEPIFKCKDCGEYLGTVPRPTKESYIEEAKSLPIQFDKDGNLIIKNIRKINFEQEYANSHRLLMEYDKTKAYDPMKFELAKMQFFITLLEKRIYKQGKEKSKDELKVRARFLNDFKKYLKIIVDNDNTFNFGEYYEKSPFNDALIKIDNSTLKYGWKALKYMIK